MTYEQFWDMDCTLVRDYRKAEEIRSSRKNQEAWLQGMYFYEALCDVAPVLRAFTKKGTKPHKYSSQPYSLTEKERKEDAERKDKIVFDKGLRAMQALTGVMNRKLNPDSARKGGETNADNN